MKRKLLSILLVGAMAAGMLTSCGVDSEETSNTTAAGSAEAEAEAGEDVFTGFEETVEITMYGMTFYGDTGIDAVLEEINEISEAEINVHVNYTPMDVATYMEQIGLMLSGGESFDLVMTTAVPVVSFSTMNSQNELMDISEYLDYYAPELMELMEDYIGATTVDGGIYAVPCYRVYNSSAYIMMRKDILDYLDLTEQAQAMSCWSDFEAILDAVAAAYDTLPEDMQVNALIANTDSQGCIINSSGIDVSAENFADHVGFDVLDDSLKMIRVVDGTVINAFASDEYKASLDLVHKWYESGYIYKDAATSSDTTDTLMGNGVTFAGITLAEVGVEATKSASIGYDVICIDICDIPVQTSNASMWAWAVPVTAEEPEAAVAFMNLMYTNADIENLLVYGVEGRDYELNDEGEACYIDTTTYRASDFCFGNQFIAYPAEGQGGDFRAEALESMNSAAISDYYGCVVDTEPISNEITALSVVLAKYEAGLESGTLDPDEYLPIMLEELEAAGAQTVIDYYQECLDAWLAQQ